MSFRGFAFGYMSAPNGDDVDMSEEGIERMNDELIAEENEFWNSPSSNARLLAELPFWIMAPEGGYRIDFENTRITATLNNNLVETSDSWFCNDPLRRVLEIIDPKRTMKKPEVENTIKESVNFRQLKSVLSFDISPLSSAIQGYFALYKDTLKTLLAVRSFNLSDQYFRSLAFGYIEAINKFISSYKLAARDPYASHISQWSIPNWYIESESRYMPVLCTPYHGLWRYPMLNDGIHSDTKKPVHACTSEQLHLALVASQPPGSMEILTAWSKYYQGDYSDCIRHAITAIEVGLEFRIKEELERKGKSDLEIERELNQTKNSFADRFDLYERLAKKKAPGPLLSEIPYIHGIRFRTELDSSRRLRHEIVHEGKRLSAWDIGQALRVIETMSWLFEWITGFDVQNNSPKDTLYSYFSMLQGRTFHGISIKDGYITPQRLNSPEDIDDTHPLNHYILSMLDSLKTSKIDLSSRIALRILGVNSDTSSTTLGSNIFPDPVFEFLHNNNHFCIFDCTTSGKMTIDDAFRFIAATKFYSTEFPNRKPNFIVISNHQKDLDPRFRETCNIIASEIQGVFFSCGISLISMVDLVAIAIAVLRYGWDPLPETDNLLKPGRQLEVPSGHQAAGIVNKCFSSLGVISLNIDQDKSISTGDLITFRNGLQYIECRIVSIESNKTSHSKALGPCRAGIKTDIDNSDFHLITPSSIFFIRNQSSAPPDSPGEERTEPEAEKGAGEKGAGA